MKISIEQSKSCFDDIISLCNKAELIVFAEEQIENGCASEYIVSALAHSGFALPKIKTVSVTDELPCQSSVEALQKRYGMDAQGIANLITDNLK